MTPESGEHRAEGGDRRADAEHEVCKGDHVRDAEMLDRLAE